MSRREVNARDLEIINRHASRLNREAIDALKYQIPLERPTSRRAAQMPSRSQSVLIAQYIDAMRLLDERIVQTEAENPWAWALTEPASGSEDERIWQPLATSSSTEDLNRVYDRIRAANPRIRFPHLYEYLILGFRWAGVEMDGYTLLANPLGPGLDLLLESLRYDRFIFDFLISRDYLPFAKLAESHDPVCFDLARFKKGDCPIVSFGHESILVQEVLGEANPIAPSFRHLVSATIAAASSKPRLA